MDSLPTELWGKPVSTHLKCCQRQTAIRLGGSHWRHPPTRAAVWQWLLNLASNPDKPAIPLLGGHPPKPVTCSPKDMSLHVHLSAMNKGPETTWMPTHNSRIGLKKKNVHSETLNSSENKWTMTTYSKLNSVEWKRPHKHTLLCDFVYVTSPKRQPQPTVTSQESGYPWQA